MPQLTAQELAAFLPHAGEMCLIDAVECWDDSMIRCRTSSHRRLSNPLRRRSRLESIAGLEYGAQAMGIHVGLRGQTRSEPGRVGYVGGLRDVVLGREWLDDCLDELIIEATCLLDDKQSFMYQFAILSGGQSVITGRASIFLKSVGPGR